MKIAILATAAFLAFGCVAAPPKEYPQTRYVDTTAPEAISQLPPPFDRVPGSGECDLVVMVTHMRGALPIQFSLAVEGERANYPIWSSERIEEGISVLFGEPTKEQVGRATRLCMVRIPEGEYAIVARIDDEDEAEKRVPISLNSEEKQSWLVLFGPLGIDCKKFVVP